MTDKKTSVHQLQGCFINLWDGDKKVKYELRSIKYELEETGKETKKTVDFFEIASIQELLSVPTILQKSEFKLLLKVWSLVKVYSFYLAWMR